MFKKSLLFLSLSVATTMLSLFFTSKSGAAYYVFCAFLLYVISIVFLTKSKNPKKYRTSIITAYVVLACSFIFYSIMILRAGQ